MTRPATLPDSRGDQTPEIDAVATIEDIVFIHGEIHEKPQEFNAVVREFLRTLS